MHMRRWAAAAALFLNGCAGLPATPLDASFALEAEAHIARLAAPGIDDWAQSRLTSRELESARSALAARRVQTVTNGDLKLAATAFPGVPTSGTSVPGRITSAPAYTYASQRAYWLTDNGWLLPVNMATSPPTPLTAIRVSSTDTFGGTAITLSFDGRRAYLCSLQGRFYAVDLSRGALHAIYNVSGANLGTTYAMAGTSTAVQAENATPAVFIDPLASRPDGQIETVYALTQRGTLHRFNVSASSAAPTVVTWVQSYALPVSETASPFEEVFRAHPVVIRGKAVVGSWRRHTTATSRVLDTGRLFVLDTGCRAPTTAVTSGSSPLQRHVFASPVWASPAVEFDNSLNPLFAFVPTGYVVSMVDLTGTGARAESPPLLVNTTTPVASSLAAYTAASNTGVVTVTVPATATGKVSVADSATFTRYPEAAPTTFKDTGALFANRIYGTYSTGTGTATDNTPAYGYLKFRVSTSHVTATDSFGNTTLRGIIGARVRVTASRASNQGAGGSGNGYDAGILPTRFFEVGNNASTGAAWDATMITPANRPRFRDGTTPFTLTNLTNKAADELPPVGPANTFAVGMPYEWEAKGRVGSPEQDYSFGMANTELSYLNTAPNNGVPFQKSAPQFYTVSANAAQNPQLVLTLSAEGLATPTMATPVTIDSTNQRIYALNCNALWAMSYRSPTYGTNYTAASFAERGVSLGDPNATYFALTRLGQAAAAGPTAAVSGARQYVANVTAPLLAPTATAGVYRVFVQDHHPVAQQTAINEFAQHPPVLRASNLLTATGTTEAKRGATYLTFDYANTRLYAGTFDPAATSGTIGRAWVIDQ